MVATKIKGRKALGGAPYTSSAFRSHKPPPADRKPAAAPRSAPAFLSALKEEEVDFPRGGGSSLTALELKQTRDEGRREADAETITQVCPQMQVNPAFS